MSIFERSLAASLALTAVVTSLVFFANVLLWGDGVTLVGLGILLLAVIATCAWNAWAWRRRSAAPRP